MKDKSIGHAEMENGSMETTELEDESIIEELLEKPYWIADILPEQVPADSAGQYFRVEEYYLQQAQMEILHWKYLNIVLKLNCYYDIRFSCDYGEHWELNPAPGLLEKLLTGGSRTDTFHILFDSEQALAVLNSDDTYLTVYHPTEKLLYLLRELARAEGLFVWKPEQ